MIPRRFGFIAATCFAGLALIAVADIAAPALRMPFGDLMLYAVAGSLLVFSWPRVCGWLRDGFGYLSAAVARGRRWCLRLVQDLQPLRTEHLGLVPRRMTGFGPLLA